MDHQHARLGALAGLGAAAVLVVAACGGAIGANSPATTQGPVAIAPGTPAATAAPSGSASAPEVTLATNAKGTTYLVGEGGRALYVFKKDTGTTSNCTGGCATAWPPFTVGSGEQVAAGAGVTGTFGTTSRADGTTQVTYDGAPLYYFSGDKAAGNTNGDGLNGVWFLASPGGASTGGGSSSAPSSAPGY